MLSGGLDFHNVVKMSGEFHALPSRTLTSLSVDEILLSWYVNRSKIFNHLSSSEELASS